MNKQNKYFISLISSFLNKTTPEISDDIDWNAIFNLSTIHNVAGIISNQISLLPIDERPKNDLEKAFKHQLGYTIISYENKLNTINMLKKAFTDNDISYLFVKGAVLKDYYPVCELRTSGDIDVYVKYQEFNKAKKLFSTDDYQITADASNGFAFDFGDDHIELHTEKDCDNPFFADIFSIAESNGCEYTLSKENHLLYVLCHIAKHFNYCGAGIRMFCDVDVLIRNIDNFDYDSFMDLCQSANIYNFAKAVFSFCNNKFNTPVKAEIDFSKQQDMFELLENTIIDGGSFGYERRNMGEHYIDQSLKNSSSNSNNFSTKLKAIFMFIFPKTDYLKNVYPYCSKVAILLPVAWLQRLFEGIFKRRDHSKNTFKDILNSDSYSVEYRKLLDELEI